MKLLRVMVKTQTYVIVLQSDGVMDTKSDNRSTWVSRNKT